MRVVRDIIITLILLPLMIVIMSPKKELYFLLEKSLYEKGIVIDNEEIVEGILSLTIKHPSIYFNGLDMATVDEIRLWSLVLYTKLDFNNFKVTNELISDLSSDSIDISHSILSLTKIFITSSGQLGDVNGTVELKERVIHLDIPNGENADLFKRYLKKDKKN